MGRKRSSPILHTFSNLLHKLRKPLIPIKLKKLNKSKELKLLRHYNYGEYQFSPSTTPLIHCHRRSHFKNNNNNNNKGAQDYLCSFFYLYWCLGNFKEEEEEHGTRECKQLEALTLPVMSPIEEEEDISVVVVAEELFDSGEDEGSESVDERAERFIERFYHEMRMQRR
ncbi:hypothetical protein RIF29_22520 [Crotalaria pallida]|uniref:Uncharacterized protein n=1 Tax=Crotalaria pallida TaxID=3830 RepID=A0AAN9I9F2_CROPI